eukprot:Skav216440  [mRNA]  locus=scaffold50:28359:40271:+ [translate_table: standard]
MPKQRAKTPAAAKNDESEVSGALEPFIHFPGSVPCTADFTEQIPGRASLAGEAQPQPTKEKTEKKGAKEAIFVVPKEEIDSPAEGEASGSVKEASNKPSPPETEEVRSQGKPKPEREEKEEKSEGRSKSEATASASQVEKKEESKKESKEKRKTRSPETKREKSSRVKVASEKKRKRSKAAESEGESGHSRHRRRRGHRAGPSSAPLPSTSSKRRRVRSEEEEEEVQEEDPPVRDLREDKRKPSSPPPGTWVLRPRSPPGPPPGWREEGYRQQRLGSVMLLSTLRKGSHGSPWRQLARSPVAILLLATTLAVALLPPAQVPQLALPWRESPATDLPVQSGETAVVLRP